MIMSYSDIHSFFSQTYLLCYLYSEEKTRFHFYQKVISVYPFHKAVNYPAIHLHLSARL